MDIQQNQKEIVNNNYIQVCARVRPLSKYEIATNQKSIIEVNKTEKLITIQNPNKEIQNHVNNNKQAFKFSNVYKPLSTNQQIFIENVAPLLEKSLKFGENTTIISHGQNASGKTYTMQGSYEQQELKGIIPQCFDYIFNYKNQNQLSQDIQIRMSMFNIQSEKVIDFQQDKTAIQLELKQDKFTQKFDIDNIQDYDIQSIQQMHELYQLKMKQKLGNLTSMNVSLSYHQICKILIIQKDQQNNVKTSEVFLIDLAGKERISKSGNIPKDKLQEITNLNKSVSNFNKILEQLVNKQNFVSYRDSILTKLLFNRLTGKKQNTLIMLNISSGDQQYQDNLQYLQQGQQIQKIKI